MSLNTTIRKVIKEAHLKKILIEEPTYVDASKYSNINFKDRVVGVSTPSKDKINPSLLADVDRAAGIAGTKASITTAVTGHGKGSRHELGLAVDVAMFDGKGYSGVDSAKKNGIYDKIVRFVNALEKMGYKVNSESGNDKAVLWFGFPNHHHHVHISRKSDNGTSNFIKPVEKGKTKEYLTYLFDSGKIYNPIKVPIKGFGVLKDKKGENIIFGAQRKSDKRIFLFYFDDNHEVYYIEISEGDYEKEKDERINGTWEKLTQNSVIKDPKSKNSETSTETKTTENTKSGDFKDDRLTEPILKAINDLIKKGVNITTKNIDKEFEQEGSTRPDLGKNKTAEKKILELISDCNKKFGLNGTVVSGYRSYSDQVKNFSRKVLDDKRSIDNVQASNTLPGFSQHHTGKAFDIYSTDESWWINRPEVKKWVADNASKYGFEITYKTKGPVRVAEPWHLYYVG